MYYKKTRKNKRRLIVLLTFLAKWKRLMRRMQWSWAKDARVLSGSGKGPKQKMPGSCAEDARFQSACKGPNALVGKYRNVFWLEKITIAILFPWEILRFPNHALLYFFCLRKSNKHLLYGFLWFYGVRPFPVFMLVGCWASKWEQG